MATQLTLKDLLQFIQAIDVRLGAKPEVNLYRQLLDEAVGVISERLGQFETSWDNDTGGELTLTSATCTLPIDCILPESIEWDGDDNRLTKTTTDWLDYNRQGWRSATGDPTHWACNGRQILLSSIPSGTTTGKLVVRGRGTLPEFAADGSTNPLTYLPRRFERCPAYYVLAELPVVHVEAIGDSSEAVRWAGEQTRKRYEIRAEYRKKWEAELEALLGQIHRNRGIRFGY